jgi:kynurenine formamidase
MTREVGVETLDRSEPLAAIDAAAKAYSNWNRWGPDDVHGTVNFIDDAARVRAAALVRRGVTFSLAQHFAANGPQTGGGRLNPVHTMRAVETDVEPKRLPHGFGYADDMVVMSLQCSTQWDGLGHIFDRGRAWNGRLASDIVTVRGDRMTGIETMAAPLVTRGVLLDVGRSMGTDAELPDGFAITAEHLDATAATAGVRVSRGDIVLVRTGQLTRVRREGWGTYAGGDAPGLSFTTAGWLHGHEIAAVATDTWGVEVRPNEFDGAFQPFHQVAIPHMGLLLGEMWELDALAADCAADGRYEFLLVAGPLPVTRAVGAPVNPIAVK